MNQESKLNQLEPEHHFLDWVDYPADAVAQPEAPAANVEVAPEGWEDGSQLGGPPVRAGKEQLAVVQAPQFNEYDIAAMIYARECEPTRGAEHIRAYARHRDAAKDAQLVDEVDISAWPDCAVPGCRNKACLRLESTKCHPHTQLAERDAQVAALTQKLKREEMERKGFLDRLLSCLWS